MHKSRIENLLEQFRARAGLSRQDLAEHCRVDVSTISRWERGFPCPVTQMVRIARLLGQPVHRIWIFDSVETAWARGPVPSKVAQAS